jgi:hypothetical protein
MLTKAIINRGITKNKVNSTAVDTIKSPSIIFLITWLLVFSRLLRQAIGISPFSSFAVEVCLGYTTLLAFSFWIYSNAGFQPFRQTPRLFRRERGIQGSQ